MSVAGSGFRLQREFAKNMNCCMHNIMMMEESLLYTKTRYFSLDC